jgi:heme-degrading monooxygenase HmoA
MSDEKAFSGSILRVFEARAKPGCADSLAEKFATTSVDVVRNQPGNQGHFSGKSVSDEDVLLFVSVWRDLNAVKRRFGDDWESSFLRPGIPNSSKNVPSNTSH